MNIRSREAMAEAFVRFSCGMVAKPAVLVVTDWNSEACSLSKREKLPIVRGLLYSKTNIATVPARIRIPVTERAILL